MVELALATGIPVREWMTADDTILATALVILQERADGR